MAYGQSNGFTGFAIALAVAVTLFFAWIAWG